MTGHAISPSAATTTNTDIIAAAQPTSTQLNCRHSPLEKSVDIIAATSSPFSP